MAKLIHSLLTKLTVSFIVLILFVSTATFLYTYNETKNAMLDSTRDQMSNTIGMIAQQFTPAEAQAIYNLQAGQDNLPEYAAILAKMRYIRGQSPEIVNIYAMRIDNNQVIFAADDVEDEPAAIGDRYDQPDTRLFDAVNGISVSDNVYTDEFGTYLSAYAPIKTTNGETLIIGADMDATTVQQREDFIGNTIYIIIGVSIAIAAAIVGVFAATLIKDIKKLNKTAEQISEGNTNVTVDVSRKDEIGDLAESFSRMVASLKFMMSENQPAEQNDKQ
jgi:methyl-accepting chemotaxis protein